MNIGAEEEKGNALVKETFPLLKNCPEINFIGSVEARDIPAGAADVIVCEAFVGNVMELVEKIEKTGQNIQVDNLGESDFVVTYRARKKKSLVWEWMKTAMVSAVAFFGAAFAIMTFNNDANVTDVFAKLYEMIIGTRADGPTILEASYSVGLALGILLFFNHFASWKITVDPTPIEVEMRLYEENLNKTLIKNGGRKESGVDVS